MSMVDMKVSTREEALAQELYEADMKLHQSEVYPWDMQIPHIRNSYRRQAVRVVTSKWFESELEKAKGANV